MARESGSPLLAFIRGVATSRGHDGLTDGELLQRFVAYRDEAALTALLRRHGPMVLGVCQSILPNAQDAEDTFQATFLVLVRKPTAVGKPGSLASWLHGVACRLAMKARAGTARRRARERQAIIMPSADPHDDVIWRDLRPVLHQEVDRLPERYRLPVVLCYLEGKTNAEAADLLGWPKGTVLSRLSRARERLRARLTRRGLALPGGVLAAVLSQNAVRAAVPTALAENTVQAALLFTGPGVAGGIAAPVLASAEGMLRAMGVAKLKLTAVILLAVAGTGAGAAALAGRMWPAVQDAIATGPSLPPGSVPRGTPTPTPAHRLPVADKDAIQGAWGVTTAEFEGRRTAVLNDRRLVFAGSRFTLSAGRAEVSGIIPRAQLEGAYTLESASPKRIELDGRNWHLNGLYLLDEKTLTIRLGEANDPARLAEFTIPAGNRQLILILEKRD